MKTIKSIHKTEQSNEDDHKQSQHAQQQQQQMCKKCHLPIDDRYIFNVKDAYWHEECLKCFQCGQVLRQKCYETETGALYCKEDFIRFAAFFLIICLCHYLFLGPKCLKKLFMKNENTHNR